MPSKEERSKHAPSYTVQIQLSAAPLCREFIELCLNRKLRNFQELSRANKLLIECRQEIRAVEKYIDGGVTWVAETVGMLKELKGCAFSGKPMAAAYVNADNRITELERIRLAYMSIDDHKVDPSQKRKGGGKQDPPTEDEYVKEYLRGWDEITDFLRIENTEANQKHIRQTCEKHEGPIIFEGRKKPKVEKNKLRVWWNSLEEIWAELAQRDADIKATTSETHDYGHSAKVIPGIGGG